MEYTKYMQKTIKINIYYIEKNKKKILDKECMVEELENKIAELIESKECSEY